MQTSPINNFIDKTVQTISNSNSVGIQANPPLTIDTMNLSPGFEKWMTYSHSEKSVQTLFNRLEEGIQTMPNPDLIVKGEIPPVGIFHDPITPPVIEYPNVLNLFDDTNALFDTSDIEEVPSQEEHQEEVNTSTSSEDIVDSWDKVKVNIFDKAKQVNIEFGKLWNEAESVHFSTKDGYLSVQQISNLGKIGENTHSNETFVWDNRINLSDNPDFKKSELKEIIIKDLTGKYHPVYRNDFRLDLS